MTKWSYEIVEVSCGDFQQYVGSKVVCLVIAIIVRVEIVAGWGGSDDGGRGGGHDKDDISGGHSRGEDDNKKVVVRGCGMVVKMGQW